MHLALNPYWLARHDAFASAPPGPRLWRIRFGGSVIDAHVRPLGQWGVAYNLFLNGQLSFGHRFATEEEAAAAAESRLRDYLADGWVMESQAGDNVA